MRQGIRGLLQKAGDLDAKYAAAVEAKFGLNKDPSMLKAFTGMTSAAPIRDVFSLHGAVTPQEKAIAIAADMGVGTANVASRYALPAGGLTAAGVGLYELAQMLSPNGDQQTAGELYM